jgi:hypothetical protein
MNDKINQATKFCIGIILFCHCQKPNFIAIGSIKKSKPVMIAAAQTLNIQTFFILLSEVAIT